MFLASDRFFILSGMRDVCRQAGMDAEFISINEVKELRYHHHSTSDFLIVHKRLVGKPMPSNFLELKSIFKGKIIVFGGKHNSHDHFDDFISIMATKNELIEKLQAFFGTLNIETADNNSLLSTRETDILKEVAMGYSNKEIAERLYISINTVITHRKNITEKLGIKSISGLTVYALMNQLISPEDVND